MSSKRERRERDTGEGMRVEGKRKRMMKDKREKTERGEKERERMHPWMDA